MPSIRDLRQERGWTQFELALRVGVHPQAIYLWESGRRTPQVAQLRKLGKLFGLCSDDIDLVTPSADTRDRAATRGRAARRRHEAGASRDQQGRQPTSEARDSSPPPDGDHPAPARKMNGAPT